MGSQSAGWEAAAARCSTHIIALNERHLRRLIRDYVNYHHEDRIHDSLDKDTPNRRLGGLHHWYSWREAA